MDIHTGEFCLTHENDNERQVTFPFKNVPMHWPQVKINAEDSLLCLRNLPVTTAVLCPELFF